MITFVPPKTGEEIAKDIGISRQAVSQHLKRAIRKFYTETKKLDSSWGPFDTAVVMSVMLNIGESDLNKFLSLFPPMLKKKIKDDARSKLPRNREEL